MRAARRDISICSILLLLLASLTSCSDDSPAPDLRYKFFVDTPELFFNLTPTMARGVSHVDNTSSRAAFIFDNNNRLADIFFYELDLGQGPADYTFRSVPWEFVVGTPTVQRRIAADCITSDSSAGADATITDLEIIYIEPNKLDADNCRGVIITFTCGQEQYCAYPRHLLCKGTAYIDSGYDTPHIILYEPTVAIDFSPDTYSATLTISHLRADAGAEPQTLVIAHAAVEFTPEGYTITLPDATLADSTERVTDLTARAVKTGELTMQFQWHTSTAIRRVTLALTPMLYDTPTVESEE